ncbi:galactonate dehydratase [Paenibacillus sp. FA6]|uniref:galactonate dehydratase n=1 Tax=Paenibacillus sp. FA6 TaxID=3413029 RepID=UPI003F657D57
MKIHSMELFEVPPRWLFLKITTEDGIVGWGEPIVEGRTKTVRAAVEELSSYLIGQEAGNIEDLWQVMYRGGFYRGGPILTSAMSGIEQALWDIKGKRYGVPVYELLGGAVRDRMKVYAWIQGDTPEEMADSAKAQVAAGYTAIKMNGTAAMDWIDSTGQIELAAQKIAAVREAVGNGVGIAIDLHGRVHKGMIKPLIREYEYFKPMFIEEPVLPENNEALKMISQFCSIPIATGERMYTRWDFKQLLAEGWVDIIQPDLSHTGGIWEARKIAAMAEAYDVAVAPHCPLGPIALAASLQLDFCTPNAFIQEQSLGIHYTEGSDLLDYLVEPTAFQFKDGYVSINKEPGLGIQINEQKVREMAEIGHNWRNPVWRNPDGSVTEW